MTVKASGVSALYDAANEVRLREPGLSYTVDHPEPAIRLPRRGGAYWETPNDFDWRLHLTFVSVGSDNAIEIFADSAETGPGAVTVLRLPLPDDTAGEMRALVCAAQLAVVPYNEPLFIGVKLIVGANGMLDVGCVLERVA